MTEVSIKRKKRRVIDPTKNVADLVKAESKYQDGMRDAVANMGRFAREAESKMQNYARDSESKMQTWMRDAETKRIDQRSDLQAIYEARIADMLSESVKSTSGLVATQLLQIQSTFGERVSKLEEFRLLSTGRSSVADPYLATTLEKIGKNIEGMQSSFTKTMTDFAEKTASAMGNMAMSITALQDTGRTGTGKDMGRHEVIGWLVAVVMFVAACATPVITFVATRAH